MRGGGREFFDEIRLSLTPLQKFFTKLKVNTLMEIWKDIKGYEGLYKVSNLGRVKSLERTVIRSNGRPTHFKEKIKDTYLHKGKYLKVHLSSSGVAKKFRVHRLVAEAFIPNPDNKPEVNHIDLNPLNNHVSNLEWVTGEENREHYMKSDKYKVFMKQYEK